MSRNVHVSVSIDGLLRLNKKDAAMTLTNSETGEDLTAEEAYAIARQYKAKGFKVIPVCDNHNELGYCMGHEVVGGDL